MLIVSSLILLRHANSKQIKKIIIHGGATLLPIFTLFVLVVKMKAKLTLRTRR